ncbi:hypothetical protein [Bacillus smithii]|uniref:hypothetical protein n=1 Tax=Bacillus smithii TaxID=1479 RepID=UPI002E1DE7A5|nr:hypothetical protein [Bacillus smithii]MED4929036.1 hypothetical protein [Bacillus smithii]
MLKIQTNNEYLKPYYMSIDELKDMLAILEQKVGKAVTIETMTVIDYEYQYTNFHHTLEVVTNAGIFTLFIDEVSDINGNEITNISVA